jgi:hypothetical protein
MSVLGLAIDNGGVRGVYTELSEVNQAVEGLETLTYSTDELIS